MSKNKSCVPGRVPFLDVVEQHRPLRRAIEKRWKRLFTQGDFILGAEVQAFESAMARYLGVAHAVGCASGTDAIRLALKALDIGPGDEVITTALSFFATAGAILQEGAVPVFVDIDAQTYNLDCSLLEAKITAKTKAILPVHLYGCPADMVGIGNIAKAHGLKVIEDCAQATGASITKKRVGAWGDVGCFSFYPTKNLGALGDGGLVCTGDAAVAQRLRALRVHGSQKKYVHESLGINSRLDSLQAAVLNSKLPLLDQWNAHRNAIAAVYQKELDGLPIRLPSIPKGMRHVFHLFVIASERRDALQHFLAGQGIESAVYYPVAIPLQPCLSAMGYRPEDFPVATKASQQVLALPMSPEISKAQAHRVVKAVRKFFS